VHVFAPTSKLLQRRAGAARAEIDMVTVTNIASDLLRLPLGHFRTVLAEFENSTGKVAKGKAWGFEYKTSIIWYKIRADGGPDGRGVGFYFRHVTELVLFGVRGKNARTLAPGRRQVNLLATRKREHSRKPDEIYPIVESCSPGPFIELFARAGEHSEISSRQHPWTLLGDEAVDRLHRPVAAAAQVHNG
jgi:N6-adenosine-specific RNA methylase IME4